MGANGGGDNLQKLRYATSDAKSFANLLMELGGVNDSDLVLLLEPGVSAFRGAADRVSSLASMANAAGQRCEIIFYYSGHSDDEGLLLGKEKLGYSDLRASIERVPAAVRVAILDSCSSGSLTRAKGGAVRPAFLFDASTDMEGHAYITSSSEAEAAQESDKLGGSFFTHYLVSALRGAADVNGEGRVTLNEAYAYAFRETLASTENTQYGPQHPAYEINLTGSGDLVFTDLRSSRSGLSLDEALAGSIYVRDSKGKLAVELDKASGDRIDIGLPAGKYTITLLQGAARSQAEISVPENGRARLVAGNFKYVASEATTARGIEVVAVEPSAEADASAAADAPDAIHASAETTAMEGLREASEGLSRTLSGVAKAAAGATKAAADATKAALDASKEAMAASKEAAAAKRRARAESLVQEPSAEPDFFDSPDTVDSLPDSGPSSPAEAGQAAPLSQERASRSGFEVLLWPEGSRALFDSETDKSVSFNLLWGTARDLRGFQYSTILNSNSGDTRGFQFSCIANAVKGRSGGFQFASLANVALGGLGGVQLAAVNYAGGTGQGVQLGAVNVAQGIGGAQVGIVNYADHAKGTQIGIVNVAKKIEGFPIGLVNIEEGGVFAPEVWYESGPRARAGLAFGTRLSYNMLSCGFDFDDVPTRPFVGWGLGGRIPIGPFFCDVDLSWHEVFGLGEALASARLSGRALCGFPAKKSGVIVGIALEGYMPELSFEDDGSAVAAFRVDPRFMIGLKL
jgi:hypothetical protein